MKLTLCINSTCEDFENALFGEIKSKYKDIILEAFNEFYYTEKKKAFKIKRRYSAKVSPFVILTKDKQYIKAFYSEDNSCTVDNIINFLKQFYNESTSN